MIWEKTYMLPVMMFRTLIIAIIPLTIISVIAMLPCYGDDEQTAVTAGAAGFLIVASGLASTMSVLLMCDTKNQRATLMWIGITFFPFFCLGAASQIALHSVGKKGK